jgi:hypothetical protein
MDEPLHNRYYLYFKESRGGISERYEPDLGYVYSYNTNPQRGRGHLATRRRGLGLYSFFAPYLQRATPFLRNLGSKAVDLVSNIAKDTLKGESLRDSAVKNISKAVTDFTNSPSKSNETSEKGKQNIDWPSENRKRKTLIASSIARKKLRPNPKYTALKKLS